LGWFLSLGCGPRASFARRPVNMQMPATRPL
jgi:hypothetical protein